MDGSENKDKYALFIKVNDTLSDRSMDRRTIKEN